jgi:hypothetical protein
MVCVNGFLQGIPLLNILYPMKYNLQMALAEAVFADEMARWRSEHVHVMRPLKRNGRPILDLGCHICLDQPTQHQEWGRLLYQVPYFSA